MAGQGSVRVGSQLEHEQFLFGRRLDTPTAMRSEVRLDDRQGA